MSVELAETQDPIHVGEAHSDGRYAVVYSFLQNTDSALAILSLGE